MAVAFSKKYPVLGFDINSNRVQQLEAGVETTLEVSTSELVAAESLSFSCLKVLIMFLQQAAFGSVSRHGISDFFGTSKAHAH